MTRAGLLLAGHVDERSRHIAGDYPELFGALLAPQGVEVVPFAVDDGDWPSSIDERDGWICSPSRASAYDDLPWIAELERFVREAVERERAFVGICFGHQVLATALGGRVERAPDGWGVGVQDYDVTGDAPWMRPKAERVSLIASHQDQVTKVPDGVRVFSSSDYCPNAGLAIGERAWSVQGHPEFVPALADHLLAGRVDLIGAGRVAEARASLDRPRDGDVIARWIAATLR